MANLSDRAPMPYKTSQQSTVQPQPTAKLGITIVDVTHVKPLTFAIVGGVRVPDTVKDSEGPEASAASTLSQSRQQKHSGANDSTVS